jgi:hypothetical protein
MTESKLRGYVFSCLVLLITCIVILFEICDWWDSAILMYSLCILFSVACLSIWAYWWIRSDSRSGMFVMVALLLSSLVVSLLLQTWARWNFLYHRDCYQEILETNIWAYRIVFELMIIVWFFAWSIGRFFGPRLCRRKGEVYRDGVCQKIDEDLKYLEGKIIDGEIAFEGHTYEGLVIGAKIILKPKKDS